jgi:radical SAM protein with 4Fe4S-binding SPASM domain
MNCPHIPEINLDAFSKAMKERQQGARYPLIGSIEVTLRCNLRCQHCYVSFGHTGVSGKKELSTAELKRILDEITDAGTLWLLLTGGEPLMRRDFPEIYTYALKKGMMLVLFTNGTLLTPRSADLLAEWRPRTIEISLYGYTQKTYESVTGIPGSHARCMRGIELLLERGLPLKLKTMAMTLNVHELPAMQAFAESLEVDFRFDGMLNESVVPGCGRPLELRLSPHVVVQLDLESEKRTSDLRKYFDLTRDVRLDPNYLYQCGAGVHSYNIDSFGQLYLCMMTRRQGYDLRHGTFSAGWEELGRLRGQPPRSENFCTSCDLAAMCSNCPGWSEMEHGDPLQRVDFQCQITHLRARALGYISQARLEAFPLRQETDEKF